MAKSSLIGLEPKWEGKKVIWADIDSIELFSMDFLVENFPAKIVQKKEQEEVVAKEKYFPDDIRTSLGITYQTFRQIKIKEEEQNFDFIHRAIVNLDESVL